MCNINRKIKRQPIHPLTSTTKWLQLYHAIASKPLFAHSELVILDIRRLTRILYNKIVRHIQFPMERHDHKLLPPQTLDEALKLLAQPDAHPLGGGTWLNQSHDEKI